MTFSSCHIPFLTISSIVFLNTFSASKFNEIFTDIQSKEKTNGTPKMTKSLQNTRKYFEDGGGEPNENQATFNGISVKPNSLRIRKLGTEGKNAPLNDYGDREKKGPNETKRRENAPSNIKMTVAAQVKFTNHLLQWPTKTKLLSSVTTTATWPTIVNKQNNKTVKSSSFGVGQIVQRMKTAVPTNASDPLQMTRENCRKMGGYATVFGISDPSEWVRSNCFFLQMYIRASCNDIDTFVTSCSKYENGAKKEQKERKAK